MDKYSFILFDWDGCLAKTLEVWLYAYKTSLKNFDINPADEDIAHHFGDWELPKYFGVIDFEKCNSDAVDIAREKLRQVELYEGTMDLLDSIYKSKSLALLSSSSRDVLLNGISHNGLAKYFKVILSGDDVDNHKPHPEIIEKGLAAIGGKKEKAVMIGDSRKDLEAAKNAGIDSILVYPDSHKMFYLLEDLKEYSPTHICNNLYEVRKLLTA